MEAIIQTGGRQYKVKKDQKLSVNKLVADIDTEITFDALAVVSEGKLSTGKSKVVAKVLSQTKGDKVTSATFKRRKGFHKKKGHRQQLTQIQIKNIQA
jgi:large subunit ribosomal protein L21